jgi:hypothetical protein
VYVDQGYSDAQKRLEAQLKAAQAAWAAEKSRRRATEHLAPPPSLGRERSLNMEASIATFATRGKKGKKKSPSSPSTVAKLAAKAHQAEAERKARDTLAAAEEAWAAEKRRHAANLAAQQQRHDGPPGLQHHRSAGGRVMQRRIELGKASDDPEPNRPWFGGSSPPSATESAGAGTSDDGSGLGSGDSW